MGGTFPSSLVQMYLKMLICCWVSISDNEGICTSKGCLLTENTDPIARLLMNGHGHESVQDGGI